MYKLANFIDLRFMEKTCFLLTTAGYIILFFSCSKLHIILEYYTLSTGTALLGRVIHLMSAIPTVILDVTLDNAITRRLMRGVAKYSAFHGPWFFSFERLSTIGKTPQLVSQKPDALIIDYRNIDKIEDIVTSGLPVVIYHFLEEMIPGVINVVDNNREIGKIAATYLLNRGFKSFAFCGHTDMLWSVARGKGFMAKIAEVDLRCYVREMPYSNLKKFLTDEPLSIVKWLESLPKPLGLMACDDFLGHYLLDVCKYANIHVPEEVAVIGCDNDDVFCSLSTPPLSSIMQNAEGAGYQAAKLLHNLMDGEDVTNEVVIIEPTHVITRQSTDVLAIEDKNVADAVRFIRQHADKSIQVIDVAEAVGLSRRALVGRFQKAIGSTIIDEIRRMRSQLIANLLLETDLSITEIAHELDYRDTRHIGRYFQNVYGIGPIDYRNKYNAR